MIRSALFVPGDSERKMLKGLACGADCLFVDLEDSVADSRKPVARTMARDFIAGARERATRPLLFVRVNALDTGLVDADLDGVMGARPDGILLPKPRGGVDVQHLAAKIAVREAEHDIAAGTTGIICVATETAAAVFGLPTYAGASRRLLALTWGAEDLSADVGAETNRMPDGTLAPPYLLVRTLTLFAAVAAGVQPMDSVFPNFRDEAGFRRECEDARRDGFTGKMAIHPAQVPIINEVFTVPAAEVAQARKVVAAFAAQPDAGVVSIEGEMFDKPHLARARKLLRRAGVGTGAAGAA